MCPAPASQSSVDRPGDDHYPTPLNAIYPLIRSVPLPHRIWEPACGEGHIAEVLATYGHDVVSTNLEDRGYGKTGVDFLMTRKPRADCIVTNPPFSADENFVLHAIDLGVEVACFFLRSKFLEGKDRYRDIHSRYPPFAMLQFIQRIKIFSGDIDQSDQPGMTNESFAWFVWVKGFVGRPTVGWLSRDDGLQLSFIEGTR